MGGQVLVKNREWKSVEGEGGQNFRRLGVGCPPEEHPGRYDQKNPISKISVNLDFALPTYASLCVLQCSVG